MTTQTNLKAGRRNNRIETLVREGRTKNLKLKTHVRAGAVEYVKFKYHF